MTASDIEVPTTQVSILDESMLQKPIQQLDWLAAVILHWRRDQLWVKLSPSETENPLPALYNDEWLKRCLTHSPIWAVCLEPVLGEATLERWSNVCEQVKKTVFLRSTSFLKLPRRRNPVSWRLKRGLDWLAAACLLGVLSPFLLILTGWIRSGSGQSAFAKEWRVGYRGELFRMIKFRSLTSDVPHLAALGQWMQASHLDELPQLVNVLQGKMSLVGPRPWTLGDAIQATSEARKRLNALPGMFGVWQAHDRAGHPDSETALAIANQADLHYLNTWSLFRDFKLLLSVLSGSHRP